MQRRVPSGTRLLTHTDTDHFPSFGMHSLLLVQVETHPVSMATVEWAEDALYVPRSLVDSINVVVRKKVGSKLKGMPADEHVKGGDAAKEGVHAGPTDSANVKVSDQLLLPAS